MVAAERAAFIPAGIAPGNSARVGRCAGPTCGSRTLSPRDKERGWPEMTQGEVQAYPPGSCVLPLGRLTWNPNVVLPFDASVPLLAVLRAMTVWPLCERVVFQEPVMVWPAGSVNVTVQALMVAVPVFVTRTGSIT